MSSSDVGPTTTSEKRALSVEKEVVFSSKYTIRKICFKSDKFIPSGKSSVFIQNPNSGFRLGTPNPSLKNLSSFFQTGVGREIDNTYILEGQLT